MAVCDIHCTSWRVNDEWGWVGNRDTISGLTGNNSILLFESSCKSGCCNVPQVFVQGSWCQCWGG